MKSAINLSSNSNKLASAPEMSQKKGQLNLPLLPNRKEKHGAKSVRDKIEPMVLRSPPTGESVVRYALPIPSSKTKELIAEDEMIRKITKHLKVVVSNLEESYGSSVEDGEKPVAKPGEKELSLSVGDDMSSFLVNCSQFAVQLEEAVKEEHDILESLFKWFQLQVNQMEELSRGYSLSETDILAPEKTVSLNISKVVTQMQKLEELKNQLTQMPKYSLKNMPCKPKDYKENQLISVESCENIQQKIEEFIKTHSVEEVLDTSETETHTASMTNQFNMMLKVFEKQSDMLKRAEDDQGLLEAKYKQMQNDFELLSEEKSVLENELQKLKDIEITQKKHVSDRTKKTVKIEKKKDKEKPVDSERVLSQGIQLKVKESLFQVQKRADALEIENRVLQEQLKQALQEAERSKLQLDYFLNQGVELIKSEGKTKTMETGFGKTQGEHSKNMPLDREKRAAFVSNSGEQRTNDIIQEIPIVQNQRPIEESSEKKRSSSAISDLSQNLNSQDKSAFLEISHEVSTDEALLHTSSSENHDKPRKIESPSKKNQESPSVKILPDEKETVISSLILPPVLNEGNSKVDVSEEKLQTETQNQTAEEFEAFDEESNKNLVLEHQDSITETKIKGKKTPKRERLITHEEVPHENEMKDQDSVPKTQVQSKKQKTSREELNNQELIPMCAESPLPRDSKSKDHPQSKKRKIAQEETLEQDMNESFEYEDLESYSEYKNQKKIHRALQSQKLKTKYEATSDTSKNLPKLQPSISDIIFQLDLDKVVENDPELLKDDFKQPLLKSELKTLAVNLPGIDKDRLTHAVERGKRKSEFKIQVKSSLETDTQPLTDIRGKHLIIKDEMNTKPKSHLGMSLSKGKNIFTQEDSFVKHTAPRKFSTKSSMDNQVLEAGKHLANILTEVVTGVSLQKNKDTFKQHQEDIQTKNIIPTKFPKKSSNLSSFQNKVLNTTTQKSGSDLKKRKY
uniref:coiled-coil domain-containing protein 7 isoform X4 n=1 Tax=Ictidomys tridecemlineatus TaxID=43179 RepID=UPI001A9D5E45|nr:coiled-coil domain-containing protein 7 isoform X4 [Ictidomys tridecemlineatus]